MSLHPGSVRQELALARRRPEEQWVKAAKGVRSRDDGVDGHVLKD